MDADNSRNGPEGIRLRDLPWLWMLPVFFLLLIVAAVMFRDYVPGTLRFDGNGFPHGTGWESYYYRGGQIKLREKYVAGKLRKSIWFRPGGSIIRVTDWTADECGTGIYVREDGSIKTVVEYRNGLAEGKYTRYRADGSVESEEIYSQGQRVTLHSSPASNPP